MINHILSCENTKFLPPDVTCMFLAMFIARQRAVARKKLTQESAKSQLYPGYPLHTVKNVYSADKIYDTSDGKDVPCSLSPKT